MFKYLKKKGAKAEDAEVGKFIFLMNYKEHYAEVFKEISSNDQFITSRILAELYIFRGWTTQFGYRIFSSNEDVSEKIIGEVVNSSNYLGLGLFEKLEGVSVEKELRGNYLDIIENRWRKYDLIVSTNTEDGIPTRKIVGELTDLAGIKDPLVFMALCYDFLGHLDKIKEKSLEIGLLA